MRIKGKVYVDEIERVQRCNVLLMQNGRATVVTKRRTILNRIVKYGKFEKDGCVYIDKAE